MAAELLAIEGERHFWLRFAVGYPLGIEHRKVAQTMMNRIIGKSDTVRCPGRMKVVGMGGLLTDGPASASIDSHHGGWIAQSIREDFGTITPEVRLPHTRHRI